MWPIPFFTFNRLPTCKILNKVVIGRKKKLAVQSFCDFTNWDKFEGKRRYIKHGTSSRLFSVSCTAPLLVISAFEPFGNWSNNSVKGVILAK